MSNYTTYQCNVCRRTKDVIKDNVRAVPNKCIITKGCSGRLFKIGETTAPSSGVSVSGLTDWYPRGQKEIVVPVISDPEVVSLSTSDSGAMTLAIYQSSAATLANPILKVKFIQKQTRVVSQQQYIFKNNLITSIISGRDSTGKNLRFDQTAIDEDRIFVRVNGIPRFSGLGANEIVFTVNTVTFNTPIPAGSAIDVSVHAEKDSVERFVKFTANASAAPTSILNSWGNVKHVREYDSLGVLKPEHWHLYTSDSFAGVTSISRLCMEQIYLDDETTVYVSNTNLASARFFLAAAPNEGADRYLNFIVEASALYNMFILTALNSIPTEIVVERSAVTELYPPLQLIKAPPANSSFTSPDIVTTDISIPSDTAASRLSGNRIIGPL